MLPLTRQPYCLHDREYLHRLSPSVQRNPTPYHPPHLIQYYGPVVQPDLNVKSTQHRHYVNEARKDHNFLVDVTFSIHLRDFCPRFLITVWHRPSEKCMKNGAARENRTLDLSLTKGFVTVAFLYIFQLNASKCEVSSPSFPHFYQPNAFTPSSRFSTLACA